MSYISDEQARQVREALFDARTELWGYANPSWSNKAANLCDKLDAAMKTLIIDTAKADDIWECQNCEGQGWVSGSEPECCGNVADSGECRGGCAVEKQIQIECSICGGGGEFPLPKLPITGGTGEGIPLCSRADSPTTTPPDCRQEFEKWHSGLRAESYKEELWEAYQAAWNARKDGHGSVL